MESYTGGHEGLVSESGMAALVRVTLLDNGTDVETSAELVEIVSAADINSAFRVTTLGPGSIQAEVDKLAEDTLARGELIGIAVALVILLVVFGSAVAAGLPIVLALVSIIVAVGAAAIVGQVLPVEQFVIQIIMMIGLAVGIDYALFIIKRYREELAVGRGMLEAITVAGNTTTRTVLVSGASVVIALSGLFVIPESTFRSFGLGAVIVVTVAMLAAMTLLPAAISILGNKLDWIRLPRIRGLKGGAIRTTEPPQNDGFWDKMTGLVMRHPVASVILTSALLVSIASFSLTMNLGMNGIETLPEDSDGLHAFPVLTEEFGTSVAAAPIAVSRSGAEPGAFRSAISELIGMLEADSYFPNASVVMTEGGDIGLIDVGMLGDIGTPESEAAVNRLRDSYLPATIEGVGGVVHVGGDTAEVMDSVEMVTAYIPYLFAFVLGSSFLLLLIVFRSIIVPLKAVLMNLLSVGATYGLLVLVFQEGVGADLFGFKQVDVIEMWLPLFLFSVLFGLSMDYHVFMLSRIKERYDQTGNNRDSVAFGLRNTASIITGAALIMVAVFGGFAIGELTALQQMGFGLAAAVVIDVTLIRSVLVPATMELLGDRNWYFPKWLEWLPRLDLENPTVPATRTPGISISVGSD